MNICDIEVYAINSTEALVQFSYFNVSFKQVWPFQTLGFSQSSDCEWRFQSYLN